MKIGLNVAVKSSDIKGVFMKKLLGLLFLLMMTSGCKHGVDRLLGTEKDEEDQHVQQVFTVACCRDNDGSGNLSYPSFLPQSHIDLCEEIRVPFQNGGKQINGDWYWPSSLGCGTGDSIDKIGDQYYDGHPGYAYPGHEK